MFEVFVVCLHGLIFSRLSMLLSVVLATACCLALLYVAVGQVLLPLTQNLSVEWAVLRCGPEQIVVPPVKTMWPHAAQTTSECGLSDQIS